MSILQAPPAARTPGAGTRVRRRRRRWEPVLYIAPAFVVMALIIGYPVISAIGTSFLHSSLAAPGKDSFAGFSNYVDLIGSEEFLGVLGRTAVWAIASLVTQVGLALFVANILNKKLFARGFVRTSIIVPWVVPSVIVALIWRFLLDPAQGPINALLRNSGLLEAPPAWLASTATALPTLIVIGAWKWTPFAAVILLAGMQQIPHEQYEAATVDGASAFRRWFHITLPGIRTSLALVCLTTISGSINNFNGIWLFTRGGPVGSTDILTTLAYRTAFQDLDLGMAATASVVIFVLMLIIAVVYFFVVEGRSKGRRS
ncbi:carbohydrate ABC transporter permease [Nakamurella lactea]|uniref:carbohydrate ABC transporter permease n=1 Tax=Nakamurella lactea TaxID=459515 RepID=UPI0003F79680|nr:sugar ABC transporter permease [Nakamurella lactea]